MSEHKLDTEIGSEISVTVWFDYEPEEQQTHDHPGCPSEVILNSVSTGGNGTDILECLNDEWCKTLEERCEEMIIANWQEQYERSQEEA